MAKDGAKAVLNIHNVGQGNCVTLQVEENGISQYMMVDIGSLSYGKEIRLLKELAEEKRPVTPPPSSPPSSVVNLPSSTLRPTSIKKGSVVSSERDTTKKQIQLEIRKALGAKKPSSSIQVKTVVIPFTKNS